MERIEGLQLLHKSVKKFLKAPTIEQLSRVIVEEARRIIHADHGSFFLSENNKLERVYTTAIILKKTKIKKNGYLEKAFQSGKTLFLYDSKIVE